MEIIGEKGEPWFDDGNIIIVTGEELTSFRIHRGVLARHSEVFRNMFDVPQPASGHDIDIYEGCQVVRVYDQAEEFSNLVVALYDGVVFQNRNVYDFFFLAGILRLSTKYFIEHLRRQAIRHLTSVWTHTLDGHDNMVNIALRKTDTVDNMTYPYVHPLLVIHLAKETNVRIVLPSAFYFLSTYPLPDILNEDHPKLTIHHPSKPSSALTTEDLKDYTLMYQYRINVLLDFIRQIKHRRSPVSNCLTIKACSAGVARYTNRLSSSWTSRTGPLYFMIQAVDGLQDDSSICQYCRNSLSTDIAEFRRRKWQELPSIIDLPDWGDLEAVDLGT